MLGISKLLNKLRKIASCVIKVFIFEYICMENLLAERAKYKNNLLVNRTTFYPVRSYIDVKRFFIKDYIIFIITSKYNVFWTNLHRAAGRILFNKGIY